MALPLLLLLLRISGFLSNIYEMHTWIMYNMNIRQNIDFPIFLNYLTMKIQMNEWPSAKINHNYSK